MTSEANRRQFATTRWSVVLAAGQRGSPESDEALGNLCHAYWYPLYAFVRMRGYDAEDSRDLTQSFFTQLLDKSYLKDADQQRGRFRSFLLAALKHFLANEWDRAHAKKRGGDSPVISIDSQDGERRYRHEPTDSQTAEKIYERRWALTLLNQVLMQLEDEYRQADKSRLFECLQSCLQGNTDGTSYAQLADQLGMTEGVIKVAVHRLRRRYRELLTAEIAQTVGSPLEIEEEIRCLFDAVGP